MAKPSSDEIKALSDCLHAHYGEDGQKKAEGELCLEGEAYPSNVQLDHVWRHPTADAAKDIIGDKDNPASPWNLLRNQAKKNKVAKVP